MPKDAPKGKKVKETRAPYRLRQAESSFPDDWDWVRSHRARLEREYADRWVAVAGGRVVGVGVRLVTALNQAKKRGVDHPLVVAIKPAKTRRARQVGQWL